VDDSGRKGSYSAVGKTRALGYHLRAEAKTVNLRFILVVVTITLGFGSFGCSRSPNPEPGPSADDHHIQNSADESGQARQQRQWWHDESITAEIGLTDDQFQAINDLMTVGSGDSNQQRQRERQLSLRYLRALDQEPYDPALADRVGKKLIEVQSSKNRQRVDNIRAIRDILNHEQWTRLWEVAPGALQIGGFRVLRGPKISVSEADGSPTPTP
jgi:Spy/CpxP family protein refolding chaperone